MALALVFPGQGSQSVGMLAALAAEQPEVERTFAEASHVLGYDLWQLCQQGPEAELARTERTQPAMLAAGVACFRAWRAHAGPLPVAMAGHSLGEYTALVCSGALEFPTAVALVQERGRLMQAAVPEGSGAMAAILGLDDDAAIAACAEAAQGEVVEAVNFNSPGQVVIAGQASAVARAIEAAKARGAKRAVTLPVSVPSHSALMRGAARQLGERLASTPLRLPQVPDVYTVDLARHASVEGIRGALEAQLYRPVRWTETIRAMLDRGITTIVECGPGKVLTSLNRRIDRRPELAMLAIDDPKSLAQALQACRERMHG
jgi:[acyl-carrier-protein] S-malonyltransferase